MGVLCFSWRGIEVHIISTKSYWTINAALVQYDGIRVGSKFSKVNHDFLKNDQIAITMQTTPVF